MPDARIESLAERAQYAIFWKDRQSELARLGENPGWDYLGTEALEEYRLVQQFALHIVPMLTYVQDALLTRNIEGWQSGDFDEVLALLER